MQLTAALRGHAHGDQVARIAPRTVANAPGRISDVDHRCLGLVRLIGCRGPEAYGLRRQTGGLAASAWRRPELHSTPGAPLEAAVANAARFLEVEQIGLAEEACDEAARGMLIKLLRAADLH